MLLAKVKGLHALVDAEGCLVTRRPLLRSPAQLDLLGFTFIAGVSDLTQPLLHVSSRQHTTYKKKKKSCYKAKSQRKKRKRFGMQLENMLVNVAEVVTGN